MREIKFRARHSETGEWFYYIHPYPAGWPAHSADYYSPLAFWDLIQKAILLPSTLGLFAGNDSYGGHIFEGDIVQIFPDYDISIGVVKWDEEYAGFVAYNPKRDDLVQLDTVERILGNIYDNPDLLEEK